MLRLVLLPALVSCGGSPSTALEPEAVQVSSHETSGDSAAAPEAASVSVCGHYDCDGDPDCLVLCEESEPHPCGDDPADAGYLVRHEDQCYTMNASEYCVRLCNGIDNCHFEDNADARPSVLLGCHVVSDEYTGYD